MYILTFPKYYNIKKPFKRTAFYLTKFKIIFLQFSQIDYFP